jgi:small subunit ribosomal protein S2
LTETEEKHKEFKMAIVSMKALLESGVHFGHRTHKWNPAMKPYIFTERNGIHILDLQKTVIALEEGYNLVRDTVAEGGTVLFVGTKRQAQDTIHDDAERVEMPYVTTRWLGGMLTNWRTIRQRVNELDRLERMRDRGEFSRITKKEALILQRKMDRLEYLLGGIRKMTGLPDLLFVVDVYREATAIHEANLLKIPVIAMVDTNCDPNKIDFVIPSNDDAIRAIKLLVGKMADAVMEGKALRKEEEIEAMPEEPVMVVADEPELSDEELLGAATLAKLPSRQPVADDESGEAVAEADQDAEVEADQEAEAEADQDVEAEADQDVEVEADQDVEVEADQEADQEAEVEADQEADQEAEAEAEAEADQEAETEADQEAEAEEAVEVAAEVEVAEGEIEEVEEQTTEGDAEEPSTSGSEDTENETEEAEIEEVVEE